jgi:hypothetical protein
MHPAAHTIVPIAKQRVAAMPIVEQTNFTQNWTYASSRTGKQDTGMYLVKGATGNAGSAVVVDLLAKKRTSAGVYARRTNLIFSGAKAIGRPAAVKALGVANGCNPVGVVLPCS